MKKDLNPCALVIFRPKQTLFVFAQYDNTPICPDNVSPSPPGSCGEKPLSSRVEESDRIRESRNRWDESATTLLSMKKDLKTYALVIFRLANQPLVDSLAQYDNTQIFPSPLEMTLVSSSPLRGKWAIPTISVEEWLFSTPLCPDNVSQSPPDRVERNVCHPELEPAQLVLSRGITEMKQLPLFFQWKKTSTPAP